jgi:hypothetical protein
MESQQTGEPAYKSLKAWANSFEHIIAVILAAVGVVWLFVSPEGATHHLDGAFAAMFGVHLFLCIRAVRTELWSEDEVGVATHLSDRFARVENSVDAFARRSDYVIGALKDVGRLIECPTGDSTGPSIYVELFGGFSGSFYAYNPAYNIENDTLTDAELLLIKEVYVPRYQTAGRCTARYLFYTGDREGERSLKRFKKLMRKVANSQCPAVISSIHIKQIHGKRAAAHEEVYFGTQHGREVVVCEIATPLDSHGKPAFYYVSESTELFKRCAKDFNSEWARTDAHDVYKYDPAQTSSFFTEPEAAVVNS